METISQFIRSLIFSIYFCISISIYGVCCLAMWPIPLRYRHQFIRSFLYTAIFLLKWVCRINYHVEGLEHIPKDRAVIILSKHQSTWETFILPLIFHEPAIILKRELLWIPLFGWGLLVTDPIAINRTASSSAMQQVITKGSKCLAAGRSILIFPEGTRIPYGKTGHYKLGGTRLAVATGTPILPVAHNAGRFWPKRRFIKQAGTVKVVIGPLIESKNQTPEALLKLAKTWIEETVQKIDKDC